MNESQLHRLARSFLDQPTEENAEAIARFIERHATWEPQHKSIYDRVRITQSLISVGVFAFTFAGPAEVQLNIRSPVDSHRFTFHLPCSRESP